MMLTAADSRVEPAASAQHSGPSKGRRAWFGRLLPFTLPVLLVVTWQVAAQLHLIDTVLIPSPQQVFRTLVEAAGDGSLWENTQASLLRWGSGFALGGGLGVMFGSLVGLFRLAEQFLDSTFQMLRTVPHLGLMPLLILWLGLGESPKLVMVGLASFFPLYLNTMAGIRNVDRKLVEVGRVHGLGTVELLRRVVLPAALPSILVGARYGLGSAWVGLIVAELMGATSGLGFMLSEGQALSRVDIVVGGLVIFALAGKLVDVLVRAAERRFLHSRDTYQGV